MAHIDQAIDIRKGEQLDQQVISDYIASLDLKASGECHIKQFPGGASNLTYLLSFDNLELVLRRPPFGTIAKSAHDMVREAKVIQQIAPYYAGTPKIIDICEDQNVMGCSFYLMERIRGFIPRQDLPEELAKDAGKVKRMCLNGIDKLIELHQINIDDTPLQQLGKGGGYVERQIRGWSDRFVKSKTDDVSDFKSVMAWLKEHQPSDIRTCVIHNDFRFDNLVYEPEQCEQVVGVLDWEMATLGDPLMDLGNSLAYWVQADDHPAFQMMRRQPTHTPGMLTRDEVVEYYLSKTGLSIDNFSFYSVYGLFRLAVIIQQIYFRYYHKQTQDQRFAGFGQAANYLEQRCLSIISAAK